MTRIGFLTSTDLPDLTEDDRLVIPHLQKFGITVVPLIWDSPGVVWSSFAGIIIRSPWDYHLRAAEFGTWLDTREREGVPLWNCYDTVRWNMDKRYLLDLQNQGNTVVPTVLVEMGAGTSLDNILSTHQWSHAVVKPSVSASAHQTWRTAHHTAETNQEQFGKLLAQSSVLVQPFMSEIETAGEWSLMFFGNTYSHAVLKRPMQGDFRVQSEFGGSADPGLAPEELIREARSILKSVQQRILYARVDGVVVDGGFMLMELELIEPALFLAADPAAPGRLADAIVNAIGSHNVVQSLRA